VGLRGYSLIMSFIWIVEMMLTDQASKYLASILLLSTLLIHISMPNILTECDKPVTALCH
jgi:hypothetical protein